MKIMRHSKKYRHIGYSYAGVPKGWEAIVKNTIEKIEKEMWVQWLPMFVKRWIHYLATGNSVVRMRSCFWNNVRTYLTHNRMITDIKDKYGELRVYGYYGSSIENIIKGAELECNNTCERCGKTPAKTVDNGWIRVLCKECRKSAPHYE